jgi:NADH:ubiquinone oxidoreductase subunit H
VELKVKIFYLTLITLVFRCVGIVLCVPFLTLYERKILSYSQNRKGPKKISLFGLFQPIVDGIKLIIKESGRTLFSKKLVYYYSRVIIFILRMRSVLILTKFYYS